MGNQRLRGCLPSPQQCIYNSPAFQVVSPKFSGNVAKFGGGGESCVFFFKDGKGSSFPPIPILTALAQHIHYGEIIALLDSLKVLS